MRVVRVWTEPISSPLVGMLIAMRGGDPDQHSTTIAVVSGEEIGLTLAVIPTGPIGMAADLGAALRLVANEGIEVADDTPVYLDVPSPGFWAHSGLPEGHVSPELGENASDAEVVDNAVPGTLSDALSDAYAYASVDIQLTWAEEHAREITTAGALLAPADA